MLRASAQHQLTPSSGGTCLRRLHTAALISLSVCDKPAESAIIVACRRETWGQLIGSYVVVAMMFAAGGVVAAALAAHRLLLRRKFDGGVLHVLIQHIMSAVWWSHNHFLAHLFGRGS